MRSRSLLTSLHRYLALLAGGVIVLLGLSGGALVFRKEIDDRIYGRFESIEPLDRWASLAQVVGNVRAILPGARVARIGFPDRPDGALSLVVSAPGTPWLGVYADPYTGEVLATRPPGVFEFLRELHSTLLVDRAGDFAVGWYLVGSFGLASFALCLTGLYLSWPGRGGLRAALRINRHVSWKRTNWDLHRVIGIVTALFVLVASASGSMVVFREAFRPPGDPVVLTPGLFERGGSNPPSRWSAPPLSFDRILRQAEAALPGGRLVELVVPADPEAPISVGKAFSGDAAAIGVVWLDRRTGAVVKLDGPRQASVASAIFGQTMNAIHTGRIAGLPGRTLVLLTGLAPTALLATGLPIWWIKRRARRLQEARRLRALRQAQAGHGRAAGGAGAAPESPAESQLARP